MPDLKDNLWVMVRKLLEFPYPQICRHLVVCNLLSVLEQHGEKVTNELARAVVKAEDYEALDELTKLGKGVTHVERTQRYED